MASTIENDFRLALLALKKGTLNSFEKSFIKSIETFSKKELTSMSGKQKKFLSDIAFKGVEKPRESKMNLEQRISILEKKLLRESSDEIRVGDKVKYVGDNGKDVYLGGNRKIPLTIGKTYKVKDLYGSNVIVIDDNGDTVNGHGINSSRFVLESTRVRESQDETITDFLRKNHVSQRFIQYINRKYAGINFEIRLKDFLTGIHSDTYGDVFSGRGILLTLIPGVKEQGWVTTTRPNSYFLKNKKDYKHFLNAMIILGHHFHWFLSSKNKEVIEYELFLVDPEGDL